METRIILVRHGASHHKDDGIVGGPHGCRGLTAVGRRQAERLAQRLAGEFRERPTAIYASVLRRAVETGEILASGLASQDVIQHCGLCTWHTPTDADGKLWTEYRQKSTATGGGVYRPCEHGNESWGELVSRTGRALEEIAARHAHGTVVLVAHAETIKSSLIVFGELPLSLRFDVGATSTSITEWTTTGDPESWPRPRWTLVRLNDTAHLAHATG